MMELLEKLMIGVKKEVFIRYINVIKDLYNRTITSVKTTGEITGEFPIIISLLQRSTLNPFLFALVMNELARHI